MKYSRNLWLFNRTNQPYHLWKWNTYFSRYCQPFPCILSSVIAYSVVVLSPTKTIHSFFPTIRHISKWLRTNVCIAYSNIDFFPLKQPTKKREKKKPKANIWNIKYSDWNRTRNKYGKIEVEKIKRHHEWQTNTNLSSECSCECTRDNVWELQNSNDHIRPKNEPNNVEHFDAHARHAEQFHWDGFRQWLDGRLKKHLLLW